MQDWIKSATYAPSFSGNVLVLSGINKNKYLESVAFEVNRLSTAASETLFNIVGSDIGSKSLGWVYVKLYYASLFYAHALMRMWGIMPIYLTSMDLSPVSNMLAVYDVVKPYPFKMVTGQFLMREALGNSSVILESVGGKRGSHETLWREFAGALGNLQNAVLNAPLLSSDKKKIQSEITLLNSLISKGGTNASWPSEMRNKINYRHEFGIWYPYFGRQKAVSVQREAAMLLNNDNNVEKSIIYSGDELELFRSCCISIIYFARGVIGYMGQIGGAKSFLRYGQLKFESTLVGNAKLAAE